MDAIAEIAPQSPKEILWTEAETKVRDIEKKDPHGLKIDSKVRRTVTALQVFGLPTTYSCEGHLDHGSGYPSITISSSKAKEHEHNAQLAYVMQRHADHARLNNQAREINGGLLNQLQGYLQEFYTSRVTPENIKLAAEMSASFSAISLASQGAAQKNAAPDERSVNLAAFQNEMESFGKFLEVKFFSKK